MTTAADTPRCYAPPESWQTDRIPLPDEEVQHLVRARRARVGQQIEVLDGRGRRGTAQLQRDRDGWHARLVTVRSEPCGRPDRGLVIGLPKGDKSDWIVEKGVELGLASVQFISTARSIPRWDDDAAGRHEARWRRLAIEALKQCGCPWLPEIRWTPSLGEAVDRDRNRATLLVAALAGTPRPLREVLTELQRRPPKAICVYIGPEGDFAPEEYRLLLDAGAVPVSLGPRVLRVETAALFVASALALFFDR